MFREIIRAVRKAVIVLSLLVGMLPGTAASQEFNCEVSLDDRQINDSSYDYIQRLGGQIQQYINENRWTEDLYEPREKIRCRVQVVLRAVDNQSRFNAEVVFSLFRPVYETMQQTSTVLLVDNDWQFSYTQNSNLVFDRLQFNSLTGFIDFYMYILLGYDYDSFSELGGTHFFSQALEIQEMGQNSGAPGWGRTIGNQRNRVGLITDLTNPSFEPLRQAYYSYHRLGLDRFVEAPQEARYRIIETITNLRETRATIGRGYLFDIFFDTKYQELTSIFMDADLQTRQQAYNLLTEADPGHTGTYDRLQE